MKKNLRYPLEKLILARRDLAVGAGDARQRLKYVAAHHLVVIKAADLPDKLAKDWSAIWKKLTSKGHSEYINPSGEIIINEGSLQ